MSKKLHALLALLIVFSMLLGACAPAAAPTDVPVVEVPPTVVPEPEPVMPDYVALFTALVDSLPADKGYGTVKAASLSEELADKAPFVIDIRETAELEKDGYIEGAVNIPMREVLKNLDKLPGLDGPIVIYCVSGHRAAVTMTALRLLGYTNVRNLGGGFNAWKKAELPVMTGALPEAPQSISMPIVADPDLFTALDEFMSAVPDGYYAVKYDKLAEELAGANVPVLLDVRTQAEWDRDGYIEGATLIPFAEFFTSLDKLPSKDTAITIYCGSGHRGAILMTGMRLLGYTNVTNLAGGLGAWKGAKMPVAGWVDWPTVWGEYVSTLPAGYYSIKVEDLNTALVEKPPFLLDVREPGELESGFIAGAINIPVREVLKNLDKLPALDQPIVIYCGSGHRGAMLMSALHLLGYKDVRNLAGGIGAWKKAELPVETGKAVEPAAGSAPTVDAAHLKDLDAYLSALPEGFFSVKATDLNTELAGTLAPFVLDVRTVEEFAAGHIDGSLNVNITDLPANLAQLPADKAAAVVVLCKSGHRGAIVTMYLGMMGYSNVRNLAGGIGAWTAAELPVVQ